jgi:hypothetical protein
VARCLVTMNTQAKHQPTACSVGCSAAAWLLGHHSNTIQLVRTASRLSRQVAPPATSIAVLCSVLQWWEEEASVPNPAHLGPAGATTRVLGGPCRCQCRAVLGEERYKGTTQPNKAHLTTDAGPAITCMYMGAVNRITRPSEGLRCQKHSVALIV